MAERKDIQKERVRRYFLDAAKELIASEGLADLTTKKIGEKAGFSYATIYNYFANFNELACLAVEELTEETVAALLSEWIGAAQPASAAVHAAHAAHAGGKRDLSALERVLSFKDLMVRSYAGNTHLYFPFLSTSVEFSYFTERDGHPYVHPAWTALFEELSRRREELGLDAPGIKQLADVLSYIFHAKLHFFIRYGVPSTAEMLGGELDSEIRFLFSRLTPT